LPGPDLLQRIEGRLREAGLWRDTFADSESAWIMQVLELLKPRVKKLDQLIDEMSPFLVDQPEIEPAAAAKHLSPGIRPVLGELATTLGILEPFDAATIEQALRATAERAGVKAAALIHATRVAMTGRAVSAGLFEVLVLLSRGVVVTRLRRSVNYIPPV
jgi:glutamyl/glutaminyl-tRNA synthetase